MNYKLAKELKDAGFKFTEHDDDQLNEINGGLGYYATLEELINACGDEFEALIKQSGGWNATNFQANGGRKIKIGSGKTPTESIAKLWLKLNEAK